MRDPVATRQSVSERYADALGHASDGLVERTGRGAYAQYGGEIAQRVPAEALDGSFGCGNPLAFANVRKGDVVLDLGCGGGLDLLLAADAVGRTGQVIGVDMTDAMVGKARAAAAAAGKFNVEVRTGLIEQLPVASASVDWVISNCVINLSAEKDKVFREIARVLRPGGSMSVSDIVLDRLPWWARRSKSLYAACISGAISEGEYVSGLSAAGLADVRVAGRQHYDAEQVRSFVEGVVPPALSKVRIAKKSLADMFGDRLVKYALGNVWSARFVARKPPAAEPSAHAAPGPGPEA